MSLTSRPWLSRLGIGPRIVLVFALVFGAMGSLGLSLLRNTLLPTFDDMERSFALQSAKRVIRGFDEQMMLVGAFSRDWSQWDELYAHMQRANPAFEQSNIGPDAMPASSMHAIMLLDTRGKVAGFGVRPFSGGSQAQAHDLAGPVLARWASRPQGAGTECGLTRVGQVFCTVCWARIVQSNGHGTPVGTVVMAREVEASALQSMAQFAGVEFTLEQLGQGHTVPNSPIIWPIPALQFLPAADLHVQFAPTKMSLRYLLQDLEAKPLSWVHIQMDRKLMQEAQDVMRAVLVQLTIVALATGVVLLVTVHFWLVRPIGRLRKEVADVSAKREWERTLHFDRPDEIGALTQGINSLLAELRQQVDSLETLSNTDGLTGIANRRLFDDRLAHELARLKRRAAPLSLLLIDVDHFKLYNDHYGHPAGDAVLRQLGSLLRATCRQQDLPTRFGGEEFALLLPDTGPEGASAMAEKLMNALTALALPHAKSTTTAHVSVSIGIATWTALQAADAAELISQADKALYAAKHSGRNRACVYGATDSSKP